MWTAGKRVGWSLLLAGAVLTAVLAARYYTFDPDVYFQKEVYQDRTLGLMVHITGMLVALLAGPFQFLRPLRQRHLRLHRLLGGTYVAGAVVGALAGLYMAQYSASGAASDAGFTLLATGVLLTTTVALVRIRSTDVQSHREWMTRSYALIFSAVTLRIYLAPLEMAFGEHAGYAVVAWVCWAPNLVVAEWLIRSRRRIRPDLRCPPLRPAPQRRHEPAAEGPPVVAPGR